MCQVCCSIIDSKNNVASLTISSHGNLSTLMLQLPVTIITVFYDVKTVCITSVYLIINVIGCN
jgi:hypothetical protein